MGWFLALSLRLQQDREVLFLFWQDSCTIYCPFLCWSSCRSKSWFCGSHAQLFTTRDHVCVCSHWFKKNLSAAMFNTGVSTTISRCCGVRAVANVYKRSTHRKTLLGRGLPHWSVNGVSGAWEKKHIAPQHVCNDITPPMVAERQAWDVKNLHGHTKACLKIAGTQETLTPRFCYN